MSLRHLGEGSYAKVKKVTNLKTKAIRAMKAIDTREMLPEEESNFISEIQVLKQLDHPNILKLYEFYRDRHRYYIIMELCSGGELFDRIIQKGTFNEAEASTVMSQILSAIRYAHNNNVVHR